MSFAVPLAVEQVTTPRSVAVQPDSRVIFFASGGTEVHKYSVTIGNGVDSTITIYHNLGTRDVVVSLHDATTMAEVDTDVTHTTSDSITLGFATPPAPNSLRVTVTGGVRERWWDNHGMQRSSLSLSERLWRHIDVRGFDECWEWTAWRGRGGYGVLGLYPPAFPRQTTAQAHRLAWEMFWQRPLQGIACHHVGPGCSCGGECVRCNNPACCNPLHIYDGTHSDNQRDSLVMGTSNFLRPLRKMHGSANKNAKLTEDVVREIRRRYAQGGVSQQALADEYGVSQSKISDAIHRKTWAHVE